LKAGCDGVIGRIGRNLGFAMLALASFATAALAEDMVGAPQPWGIGLQAAAGPIKEHIHWFNNLLLWIIIPITIFVAILLVVCMVKFSAKANPVPSKNSHNTALEIAWTVVPVLILLVIAVPSFRLVYFQDRTRDADLTVNVTGRQWYWNYAFPDHGNFNFDSRMVDDADLRPGQLRNLAVDEPLVIPVGRNVRIMTHGQDVIHSFFIPSLGVQRYTIPGRTIETWLRADHTGTFYGQCNQICGTRHAYMPIVIRAVSQEEFDAWVASARTRFADSNGSAPAAGPEFRIAAHQ
jgi:cytochrome c oxidase subunit 2